MYWLGPFEYPSKQALLDRLKYFVRTATPGRITNAEGVQKLHLLLALHPDAERKIGVGIDHFLIKRNELAGRGLHLVRIDGSSESFSYKKCITGVAQSHHGKVCEALRFVVRPQLDTFRAALTFPVKCAISGQDIVHPNDLNIDHNIPFWRLLKQFCVEHALDLKTLETAGNGLSLSLVNGSVSTAFEAFHREHAELQPASKQANAMKGGTFKAAQRKES
ncbi:hypothetical protein AL062_00335 [Pseudomonas syringae pv. syringae]|uniref:DCL family protein n=1 Tax=Pseudomonas syringae TaxID=317 RepID=UPI0007604115|nr:DCL family protein [Pseudomonas syringae]KWS24843.1 hypothetical protein AL062_00335 [Pseudomonas syringae pv. syringae]